MDHYGLLREIHRLYAPQAYLEIGVWHGQSLALATCRSAGVDPEPSLEGDCWGRKPWLKLYRLTSDEFFDQHDAANVFGEVPLELVLLDGLHRFEHILRDFINAERWVAPGGCIAIHDIFPRAVDWAGREPAHLNWTGDVWRMLPCLRRYRPDLDLMAVDVEPSGLLLVRNLDPENRTLEENEPRIVDEALNDPRPYDEQVLHHMLTVDACSFDAWQAETRRALGL